MLLAWKHRQALAHPSSLKGNAGSKTETDLRQSPHVRSPNFGVKRLRAHAANSLPSSYPAMLQRRSASPDMKAQARATDMPPSCEQTARCHFLRVARMLCSTRAADRSAHGRAFCRGCSSKQSKPEASFLCAVHEEMQRLRFSDFPVSPRRNPVGKGEMESRYSSNVWNARPPTSHVKLRRHERTTVSAHFYRRMAGTVLLPFLDKTELDTAANRNSGLQALRRRPSPARLRVRIAVCSTSTAQ